MFQRIVTSLVLGPVFFGAVLFGDIRVCGTLFFFICTGLFWEFFENLYRGQGKKVLLPVLMGVSPLFFSLIFQWSFAYFYWCLFYLLWACAFVLFSFHPDGRPFSMLSEVFFGLNYIGVFLYSLFGILARSEGNMLLFYLFLLVFFGDSGAYFTGRFLGKRRLCPRVSPKKTWEGALGGLIFSVVAGGLFAHLFIPSIAPSFGYGLSMLLSIVAQAGDLVESIFKRSLGIKDSGRILPGHGGLLDRFDGAIFAAPVFYSILKVVFYG